MEKNQEKNQIENLKLQYIGTSDKDIRKKVLDTISKYGNQSIEDLDNLMRYHTKEEEKDLKLHCLELITKIKESKL